MPREWVEATANVQQWSEFEVVGTLNDEQRAKGFIVMLCCIGWPFSRFGNK